MVIEQYTLEQLVTEITREGIAKVPKIKKKP